MPDARDDAAELTSRLADELRVAEQRYLAGFFRNPERGWRAAVEYGLETASFAYPDHGWLFNALCAAYLQRYRLSCADVHTLNEMENPPPFPNYGGVHPLSQLLVREVDGRWVRDDAERLAELADRRRRAQRLLKWANQVLQGAA